MYAGHFGAALAGAGAARRTSLWLLIVAAFSADIVEGLLAAFNVNDPTRVWSHSLPATAIAGLVLAIVVRAMGGSWRASGVVLLVSISHSALDYVTAAKTYWPGVAPTGLRWYLHPRRDLVAEAAVGIAGWLVWRAALPRERRWAGATWVALAVLMATVAAGGLHLYRQDPRDLEGLSKFVR